MLFSWCNITAGAAQSARYAAMVLRSTVDSKTVEKVERAFAESVKQLCPMSTITVREFVSQRIRRTADVKDESLYAPT